MLSLPYDTVLIFFNVKPIKCTRQSLETSLDSHLALDTKYNHLNDSRFCLNRILAMQSLLKVKKKSAKQNGTLYGRSLQLFIQDLEHIMSREALSSYMSKP